MHFLIKASLSALAFGQSSAQLTSTPYLIFTQVPPENPIPIDSATLFSYTVKNENFMGPPAPIASITSKNSNVNGAIPVLNSNNCPAGLPLGSSCDFSFLLTPNAVDIGAGSLTLTTKVSSGGQTLDDDAVDKTTVQVGLDPSAAPTPMPITVVPSAQSTGMPSTAVPSKTPTAIPSAAVVSGTPTTIPSTVKPTALPTHSATSNGTAHINSLDDDTGPRPDPTPSWCSTHWYVCYLLPIVATVTAAAAGYYYSQKPEDGEEDKTSCTSACQSIATCLAAIGGYLTGNQGSKPRSLSNASDPSHYVTNPLLSRRGSNDDVEAQQQQPQQFLNTSLLQQIAGSSDAYSSSY